MRAAGPRVAVVGAGLAGLSAARRLCAGGCQVVIFESGEAAGGRATSLRREGFALDSGPHLVSSRDQALLALVAEAGLAEQMLPLRPVSLAVALRGQVKRLRPRGRRRTLRAPGVSWRGRMRLARLARLQRRFAALLDAAAPERAARLDDRSLADFARLYFGRRVLERHLEPLCGGDFLADAESASRLLFLLHHASRLHLPTGALRGGLGALPAALAARLDLRTGHRVESIEPRGAGFAVHIARPTGAAANGAAANGAAANGGAQSFEVDAVLAATPARAAQQLLGALLEAPERDFLASAHYAPAIVAHLALSKPLTALATRVRAPAALGLPLAAIALEPGGARAPAPEGAGLATLLARPGWSRRHLDAEDGEIESDLVGALERLYPRAGNALRFAALRRWPAAVPRFPVGCYRALARFRRFEAERLAEGRRLAYAGDYLCAPTLEGAVRSGQRAARALLASFR
ncbi:MAG: FAD-dependent oxidoreductase [Deltaproteobacteria bacterium]|nr:FAD-dependent oxidoreductase [Deltaproteobacteria bacterium]